MSHKRYHIENNGSIVTISKITKKPETCNDPESFLAFNVTFDECNLVTKNNKETEYYIGCSVAIVKLSLSCGIINKDVSTRNIVQREYGTRVNKGGYISMHDLKLGKSNENTHKLYINTNFQCILIPQTNYYKWKYSTVETHDYILGYDKVKLSCLWNSEQEKRKAKFEYKILKPVIRKANKKTLDIANYLILLLIDKEVNIFTAHQECFHYNNIEDENKK